MSGLKFWVGVPFIIRDKGVCVDRDVSHFLFVILKKCSHKYALIFSDYRLTGYYLSMVFDFGFEDRTK
jgi:hypothetical protein